MFAGKCPRFAARHGSPVTLALVRVSDSITYQTPPPLRTMNTYTRGSIFTEPRHRPPVERRRHEIGLQSRFTGGLCTQVLNLIRLLRWLE